MTDEVKGITQAHIDTGNPIDPAQTNKSTGEPAITLTLIKVDEILMDYMENVMKPSIVSDSKQIAVPIMMGSPERWKTIRKDGFYRDTNNKVLKPLIMIRRTGIARNPITSPVNKYLSKTFVTGWNKHNSYDKFNIQNNITPSRELVITTIPDYVDLNYEVLLWTDLVEQMNTLVEQINFENEEFWGRRGGYKFRVEIGEYSQQIELPAAQDRIVRVSFNMSVKAYLLPQKAIDQNNSGVLITTQAVSTIKKKITSEEIDGIKIIDLS